MVTFTLVRVLSSGVRTLLKCLIADDAVHARELLRSILEDLNFEIIEAADGEEALRLAILTAPDLIVIDIGMPKKNGFEVVSALRMQEAFQRTPIIGLTAALGDLQPATVRKAGFSDFLVKPIRPAALRFAISGCTARAVTSYIS